MRASFLHQKSIYLSHGRWVPGDECPGRALPAARPADARPVRVALDARPLAARDASATHGDFGFGEEWNQLGTSSRQGVTVVELSRLAEGNATPRGSLQLIWRTMCRV